MIFAILESRKEVEVVEDLKECLGTFVIIAGSIDYGYKLIKLLSKIYKRFKKPHTYKRK